MKKIPLLTEWSFWWEATRNSYSQLFFSTNPTLGILLLIASFLSPSIGLSGIVGIWLINGMAKLFGMDKEELRQGVYGFNALLLSMALSNEYVLNIPFTGLFVFSILLLLLTTTFLQGIFRKHHLPYLTLPFIVTWSIVKLSAGSFASIEVSTQAIFTINHDLLNPSWLQPVNTWLQNHVSYQWIQTYLLTLASILFQHSLLAGLLIFIGLWIHSRISSLLAAFAFTLAYWFYQLFGANMDALVHFLSGSNYIFMAIAIAGFYVIPSKNSFLFVACLIPVTVFLHISLGKLFQVLQLQTYTLAFSLIVICFLVFMLQQKTPSLLKLVYYHYKNAESQLYHYLVNNTAARIKPAYSIQLPFFGTWKVSQGYDGGITHLGKWGKALDFVIEDQQQRTYQNTGTKLEDYYCYQKPVLAPCDGYVYDILDYIEENPVGGVNTDKNWGNTIVLHHLNGLYSQVSHLKKDSIQVKVGQYVTAGTLLATCGNSGRSPEPHLHFQVQTSPEVGAPTLPYAFRYFLDMTHGKPVLKINKIPEEGSLVCPIQPHSCLQDAFNLQPGKIMKWKPKNESDSVKTWKVYTNEWNLKYLQCEESGAKAYFIYDGTMFYFTDYLGSRNNLLYSFYLSAYRIYLGIENIELEDFIPLSAVHSGAGRWIQDLIAPFYVFQKIRHSSIHSILSEHHSEIKTVIQKTFFGASTYQESTIRIQDHQLTELHFGEEQYMLCD